jgi:hypothetical protein
MSCSGCGVIEAVQISRPTGGLISCTPNQILGHQRTDAVAGGKEKIDEKDLVFDDIVIEPQAARPAWSPPRR